MEELKNISVFGYSGFIGSHWMKLYPSYAESRESTNPKYSNILYLRGTTSNYSVFTDPSKDVRVNLLLFTETLKNVTPNHNFNLISSWFCEYPHGFYSISKLTQEMLLKSYCETFNIPFKILRLSNIIGKDPNASPEKNALEYMIGKLKRNEDIEIYEGNNYRNFLDVDTCCRAIKFVLDNGKSGETYNIGAANSFKVRDLLLYCRDRLKSKSNIYTKTPPNFHKQVQVAEYFMDTSKLRELGFNNDIDIYKTLDNIL